MISRWRRGQELGDRGTGSGTKDTNGSEGGSVDVKWEGVVFSFELLLTKPNSFICSLKTDPVW